MPCLVFLSPPDESLGFRLAGYPCVVAEAGPGAQQAVESLMRDPAVGLIAIDERIFQSLPERLQKKAEGSNRPAVVPIPSLFGWERVSGGEDYIIRMIRRAVGYQLRIRR